MALIKVGCDGGSSTRPPSLAIQLSVYFIKLADHIANLVVQQPESGRD